MNSIARRTRLPYIIIGAGGHAKVVADTLCAAESDVAGFTDSQINPGTKILGDLIVLGNDDLLSDPKYKDASVAIGVGFMPGSVIRREIFKKLKSKKIFIESFWHPSAIIGQEVDLQEGVQIMAGVVIQPKVKIGNNVIVNTGVKIDHDTTIGDNSHIAPSATICGDVIIGDNCFIGAGAIIINGITIGDNSVVAAGITVYEDILPGKIYIGKNKSV